jgi:hypothetical protein
MHRHSASFVMDGAAIPGYAVTSHNTTRIATAVFDMPGTP